jgi:hypothetical protein
MAVGGGGRHVVLSVDDLVLEPIVRNGAVVVIGQFERQVLAWHGKNSTPRRHRASPPLSLIRIDGKAG